MKRATAPRYLHMGCGEGLVARIPLSLARSAKQAGEAAVKPAKRKTGGGKR